MNNNFFVPRGDFTAEDIEMAISLQKSCRQSYLMLRMMKPMDNDLRQMFGFDEEITDVMALRQNICRQWKKNNRVEVRDIQTHDVSVDLLDVSSVPEEYREISYRNMQMVLEIAKCHPEYHWLCAYIDGIRVGNVYALCHNGCIEMDDLWIEEAYRKQYVATTLMKYIAEQFEGVIYLHADVTAMPRYMYAKMGFETVETIYDYYLEW